MRRWIATLAASAALIGTAHAGDSAAFETSARAEIDARDPEAGKLFGEANAVRERDPARASSLYAQVLVKVPDFDHALRRKCGVDARVANLDAALSLCRKALEIRRSAANLAGLALAITIRGPNVNPLLRGEALRVIDEAAQTYPNDELVHGARCQVASAFGEWARVRESLKSLEALAPNDPNTHLLAAVLAIGEGRHDDAKSRIDRAVALGADPVVAHELRASVERAGDSGMFGLRRPLVLLARVTGAWALGLALLAVVGLAVSKLTLRALAHDEHAGAVRSVYRRIVWIGAAYYYLSLPLVSVFVVGGAGAVTLLFLWLGFVPVKLLLILAVATLATLWATLRSVFVRVDDTPPGLAMGERSHPRLRTVFAEVAKVIGTRDVDEVRLTMGTDLAVMERGRSLSGTGTRTLILGVGLLEGLQVRELKSLLAHEFGHFRNEDTAGGGLAIRVRRSILLMAIHLARSGAATWWNPAWWFVIGYHKLFLRMTQGASRLQEVLADRWAVNAYGSKAFRRGFKHVIKRSLAFDAHVERSVSDATDLRRGWANLYQYRPSKPVDDDELADKYAEILETDASPYDSHPAPADRLAAAKALDAAGAPFAEGDDEEAWSLFDDRESLERAMTAAAREVLRERGLEVAEAESTG